jgi:hypothetical protein
MAYLLYLISGLGIFLLSITRNNFFLEHLENFPDQKVRLVIAFFALLLIGYFLLFRKKQVISKKLLIVVSGIVFLFFIIPPIFSRDVGYYLVHARNFFEFHRSFFEIPLNFVGNPWILDLKDVWWMNYLSPYGPLSIVFTLPAVIFRLSSIIAATYIFKTTVLGAYLLSIYIFNKLALREKKNKNLWILFALNPAILIHILVDGHNDIFSLLFLLLALYLLEIRSWGRGLLAFTASALIKFNTAIFLPILWFKENKPSFLRVIISVFTVGLPTTVFLAMYHAHITTLPVYLTQNCIYSCTPFIRLFAFLFGSYSTLFRDMVFLTVYGIVFYLFLFKRKDFLRFIFWSYTALIFLGISWLAPWYIILVIPIGLLIGKPLYKTLTFFLTFYSLFRFFGI